MFTKSFWTGFEFSVNKYLFLTTGGSIRKRLWTRINNMMSNDVQLLVAIKEIRRRREATGRTKDGTTIALKTWETALDNGDKLSTALQGWAPDAEIMLIAAGEDSGEWSSAFTSAIMMSDARSSIRSAILMGMAYPVFLFVLAFGVLFLFGYQIVPAFASTVPADRWTGLAKTMVDVSAFVRGWLWLVTLLTVGLIIAFFVSLPRWDGAIRVWLDKRAPYSIYRIVHGSSWLIALAALVNAGLRNETALEQLSRNSSPWLQARISGALLGIRSGFNLGEALQKSGYDFPDIEIIDDLCIYAQLSGFDRALRILGNEWVTEAVKRIKAQMAVIFAVMIVLVAMLVALIGAGMVQIQMQMGVFMQMGMR